jgi:hypothetical protein
MILMIAITTTIVRAMAILIARIIVGVIIRTIMTMTILVLKLSHLRLHIRSLGWTTTYA